VSDSASHVAPDTGGLSSNPKTVLGLFAEWVKLRLPQE
jgi:hypothetical protein